MAKFKGVELSCQACGKPFKVSQFRKDTAKFCSAACAGKHRNDHLKKPKVEFICPECGVFFWEHKSRSGWRKFCSNECRNKNEQYRKEIGERFTGPNSPTWKSGIQNHSDGYIYENVGDHPFASKRRILQHRLVMENWLREYQPESKALIEIDGQKYLDPKVAVHHKNLNKADNHIENLQIMSNGDHQRLHNELRKKLKQEVDP